MATATRTVQLPPTPSYIPSDECASPSGALPSPHVETPVPFVNYLALIFEPPMLRELHAPNSIALHTLAFPKLRPSMNGWPR